MTSPNGHIQSLLQEGAQCQMRGDSAGALARFGQVLARDPRQPDALLRSGMLALATRDAAGAARHLEQLVRVQPHMPDAHHALGKARQAQGRMDDAASCYRKALSLSAEHAPSLAGLGALMAAAGKPAEALDLLQRAVALEPGNPESRFHLGLLLQQLNRVSEAIAAFDQAVALVPDNPMLLGMLARLLVSDRQYSKALAVIQRWVQAQPGSADPLVLRGVALTNLQQVDEAQAAFEQASALEPGNTGVRVGLCNVHRLKGEFATAFGFIEPLLHADKLETRVVKTFAALAPSIDRTEDAVRLVEKALEAPALNAYDRHALCFQAGGLYDKLGDYDRAFAMYRDGNRPSRYSPEAFDELVDRTIHAFDTPGFPAFARAAYRTERPVLVVGMPRSGTSLVEQILASHPRVAGAGEMPDIMNMPAALDRMGGGSAYPEGLSAHGVDHLDHLARHYDAALAQVAPEADRVTDKMPHNFLYLGLVNLLLPQARVIHIRRDPVDTCLSNYFQDFASDFLGYANDLTLLGRHYRQYERLMAQWRTVLDVPFLEVQYEELVADQERESRRMIDFIGLEWDDACLSFHTTKRTVSTASFAQVRNPIYTKSVERWRRYEKHLGPLFDALGITP
ncbi:MAG: sulfotransferase [Nitrospirota bacterium]|nr:sulfotransferase [Nitrospirota bacterium]